VIDEIPSWEKVRERLRGSLSAMKRENKFTKGPRDSRDLRRVRNVLRKRLLDSQRLCESLNPTVKGFSQWKARDNNKLWPKSHRKRIPTERLETTTSCSLNPTIKGIPAEKASDNNKLWPRSHREGTSYQKFGYNWGLWPRKCIRFCSEFMCEKVWSKSQDHLYNDLYEHR
jgi:hypothetical protein